VSRAGWSWPVTHRAIPRSGCPGGTACRFLAPSGRYFTGLHAPVADDDLLASVEAELEAGATWLKLVGDFPRVEDGRPARW